MTTKPKPEKDDDISVSQYLQSLISSNSELGSRLLSLLLVSSGNGKEIMDAINRGDLGSIENLDLAVDKKKSNDSEKPIKSDDAEKHLAWIASGGKSEEHQAQEEAQEENPLNAAVRNLKGEKRKKNTEASARFRIRKKQREQEKLNKLKELNIKITGLYKRIDVLLEENRHWKQKLEELNERKSKELLDRIRKRNANSPS